MAAAAKASGDGRRATGAGRRFSLPRLADVRASLFPSDSCSRHLRLPPVIFEIHFYRVVFFFSIAILLSFSPGLDPIDHHRRRRRSRVVNYKKELSDFLIIL